MRTAKVTQRYRIHANRMPLWNFSHSGMEYLFRVSGFGPESLRFCQHQQGLAVNRSVEPSTRKRTSCEGILEGADNCRHTLLSLAVTVRALIAAMGPGLAQAPPEGATGRAQASGRAANPACPGPIDTLRSCSTTRSGFAGVGLAGCAVGTIARCSEILIGRRSSTRPGSSILTSSPQPNHCWNGRSGSG